MKEQQQYTTIVSKKEILDAFIDPRDNQQSVQPFTQSPSCGQPGGDAHEGIAAHELFTFFTAEIIEQKTFFVR